MKHQINQKEVQKMDKDLRKGKKGISDDELDALLEDASRQAEKRGEPDTEPKDKKGDFRTEQTGNRRAYFILESQTNEKGEFRALIAVESEPGYFKTDWFWGSDFNQAEKIARKKNLVMGITIKEANLIVLSTMRKGAVEKPRF